MGHWPVFILSALGFAAGVSLLKFYRKVFFQLALGSVKVLNHMLEQEGEDEKIERLEAATTQLVKSLLGSVALLIFALLIGFLPFALYTYLRENTWNMPPSGWASVLGISLGATLPFLIPSKKGAGAYSEMAQLLHRMVLNNYALGQKLYRYARKRQNYQPKKSTEKFLIVSGLARSGTTSLMNYLAPEKEFASLHYGHMPFLMAPNLWQGIARKNKKSTTRERSHGDGIKIGLASAEALEEYFFKVQLADWYIQKEALVEHELNAAVYSEYLAYQSLVVEKQEKLYLAKNNNFLLRYASMRQHNSQFVMTIMLRHPLVQASSLREKHLHYCNLQKQDPFVLEYMDWLGHHEFGLHHKPFCFGSGQALPQGNPQELGYWLEVWLHFYRKVAQLPTHPGLLIVDYDQYCRQPQATIQAIYKALNIAPPSPDPAIAPFSGLRDIPEFPDGEVLEEALMVYENLQQRSVV